ncbi:MAG: aminoglycoside phosphotransferase, partial [Rhodospirillaceae bacterium]|nr:aminoglycoside phosphotransferase [Rhodospirillaceae bacterium]
MIATDQSYIIDFLSRPEAYGETAQVEIIETHISKVFLLPGRVFKLKRAVTYPYLDFSTPQLRKRYCEAEVDVNRRTAP